MDPVAGKISVPGSLPSVPVAGRVGFGGVEGHWPRPGSNPSEASSQDGAHRSACLQSDQPHVGDPLGMGPELENPDTKSTSQARGSGKYSGSPGLSQVLGTVLQQLSVSAWVPAAMLVGNIAVLLQLRADRSYNTANAVKELAGKPLGTVIILTFSLILATAVTQAFEFEVIRFLEGYLDSANSIVQAFMAARIKRHEGKQRRLVCKLENAKKRAIKTAVEHMRKYPGDDPEVPGVLDYLASDSIGGPRDSDGELARKAREITEADWRLLASASALYRIDSTRARLRSYPEERRLLPTRLGNVLRAAEDNIELEKGENLEGYVIRHYDQLSPALKSQHTDYRTRLDMYCCLVLVFSILVLASFAALFRVNPLWGMGIAAVVYGSMAYMSYEAAIATARNYGLIIQEIPQYLARQGASAETSGPSVFEKLFDLLHRNAM
jgi:hypothetical protein